MFSPARGSPATVRRGEGKKYDPQEDFSSLSLSYLALLNLFSAVTKEKNYSKGRYTRGILLPEQSSFVFTNDFMGTLHPREQNFHPAKCSAITARSNRLIFLAVKSCSTLQCTLCDPVNKIPSSYFRSTESKFETEILYIQVGAFYSIQESYLL